MKIRVGVVIAALTLSFLGPLAYAADSTDESWTIPNIVDPGIHGALFQDYDDGEKFSYLIDPNILNQHKSDPTCKSTSDPKCANIMFNWAALLPNCETNDSINCIEAVGAIKSDGTKVPGTYSRNFPTKGQNAYTGNPGIRLPEGSTGSIFTIPNLGGVTDSYYVGAYMRGFGDMKGFGAQLTDFNASIFPVTLETNRQAMSCGQPTCPDAGFAQINGTDYWGGQSAGSDGKNNCVANSVSEMLCAKRLAFPADTKFYLQLRTSLIPSGWIHGRLSEANVKISYKDTKGGIVLNQDTLYFEGKPVKNPIAYKAYKWQDLPQQIKSQYNPENGNYLNTSTPTGSSRLCCDSQVDPLKRNWTSSPAPYDDGAIKELNLWLPFMNDKAIAAPSTWSVRSLSIPGNGTLNGCLIDNTKLVGLVSTNATVYSPGPPVFNKETDSLDYQVGAPHFDPNGNVFKGTYDLLMSSSVARCLYKFSNAPIKATISVTNSSGSSEVATTVVSEKDNWLHMQAANFEFSSPTIKIKLSQEGQGSQPLSKVAAKKTTCFKGKLTKVVSTSNCPVGYKRK